LRLVPDGQPLAPGVVAAACGRPFCIHALTTLTHVQRFHASHGTVGIGHLYQGRYKSFPVQGNAYYLTVMRYVESNPVRAGIVEQAGDWRWSSFAVRQGRASKVGLRVCSGLTTLKMIS